MLYSIRDTGGSFLHSGLICVAALAALQRKKMLEKDLERWTSSKNAIEQQVFALENANINLETMKAMKAGADAMKGIHGTLYLPIPVPSLPLPLLPIPLAFSPFCPLFTSFQSVSVSMGLMY